MKVTTKTIKGWANNSDLLFSENTNNNAFCNNMKDFVDNNLQGYSQLRLGQSLKGRNATHKVVIKGTYWRGSWADPTKQTVAIFYK
jgi:hypothetical protein